MLGYLAASEGSVIDIAVYGGSCLLLASNIRDVTRDVDAVFLTERDRGYEIADIVGRKLGLPDDWLNQAVKYVAPPKGNPQPNLFPFGEYPKQGEVGLRVYTPAPEYILAMKLLEKDYGTTRPACGLAELILSPSIGFLSLSFISVIFVVFNGFDECFAFP